MLASRTANSGPSPNANISPDLGLANFAPFSGMPVMTSSSSFGLPIVASGVAGSSLDAEACLRSIEHQLKALEKQVVGDGIQYFKVRRTFGYGW
jgi:hypothetical protein